MMRHSTLRMLRQRLLCTRAPVVAVQGGVQVDGSIQPGQDGGAVLEGQLTAHGKRSGAVGGRPQPSYGVSSRAQHRTACCSSPPHSCFYIAAPLQQFLPALQHSCNQARPGHAAARHAHLKRLKVCTNWPTKAGRRGSLEKTGACQWGRGRRYEAAASFEVKGQKQSRLMSHSAVGGDRAWHWHRQLLQCISISIRIRMHAAGALDVFQHHAFAAA